MDMTRWKEAQRLELDWHLKHPWRANDAVFIEDTRKLMTGLGFSPKDYKTVIDAGCGPRLRSRFFDEAKIVGIEPLAHDYMTLFGWCDLNHVRVYPYPLEDFIWGLKAEFLMCVNCLDHAYDFDVAVYNLSCYARNLFLSFDCDISDPMHPLALDEKISERAFEKCGLQVVKKERAAPWRAGYALNYWLESANAE